MPEIGIIFEHFGPYHAARIQGAVNAASANDSAIVPIELFGKCETYAWKAIANEHQTEVLFADGSPESVASQLVRDRLFESLDRIRPDTLAVHGWSLPGAVDAIKWCRENSVPVIMMSETRYEDAPRSWIKERSKQAILAHVSSALVGADAHADYLRQLGMQTDSIFRGYNAVDNQYFATGSDTARVGNRADAGLPDNYFFASNRFVEKKNLSRLIDAYLAYSLDRNSPWHLVLAGDGPLKDQLVAKVRDVGLSDWVHFPGFLQYEQLPKYYGLASAFVHVSTVEQWGLVVNEAAASGLPLIVSRSTGCATDLVQANRNGLFCDSQDVASISEALTTMTDTPHDQRIKMGQQSRKIVDSYGPEQFGEGLVNAARHAIDNPARPGLADQLIFKFIR